jgi:hypothetical protein
VAVKVASEQPIYLHADLLCARSTYFRTALQGGFSEGKGQTVEVPWESNQQNCVLFLSWLGSMNNSGNDFTSDCMLLFLHCCAYFQVTEEYWTLVQKRISLPSSYDSLAETTRAIWIRQAVPFQVMEKLVESVVDKTQRLIFIFAWFNEKSATSAREKQELETCYDFFLMRKLATAALNPSVPQLQVPVALNPNVQQLPGTRPTMQPQNQPYNPPQSMGSQMQQGMAPQMQQGMAPRMNPGPVFTPTISVSALNTVLSRFPIAANSLESAWLLELVQKHFNAGYR